MELVIRFIYILDIIILIFILGHRGHLNGALLESFNFMASIISAFAALTNYEWLADIFREYWTATTSLPEGIAFGLIFIIVRGLFSTTTLYLQGKIRRVELYTMPSKIIGTIFGTMKGIIIASVVLVFLHYSLPAEHLLAKPLDTDFIVQKTMKLCPKVYNIFVNLAGADKLGFRDL
ncbi:MAG: CvpA family protein [bacterium]|nr:CvpA family protein [bacterium]